MVEDVSRVDSITWSLRVSLSHVHFMDVLVLEKLVELIPRRVSLALLDTPPSCNTRGSIAMNGSANEVTSNFMVAAVDLAPLEYVKVILYAPSDKKDFGNVIDVH